jgi:hypothetical protein
MGERILAGTLKPGNATQLLQGDSASHFLLQNPGSPLQPSASPKLFPAEIQSLSWNASNSDFAPINFSAAAASRACLRGRLRKPEKDGGYRQSDGNLDGSAQRAGNPRQAFEWLERMILDLSRIQDALPKSNSRFGVTIAGNSIWQCIKGARNYLRSRIQ